MDQSFSPQNPTIFVPTLIIPLIQILSTFIMV
nr:MAG TPA: hypothetical protein [Caudoviricetes sp.]DAE87229.1 MAG TPA: hypothetical protein [Caudoviricetes sp.]